MGESELVKKVSELFESGKTLNEVADLLGVSRNTLERRLLLQRYRIIGEHGWRLELVEGAEK